MTYYVPGIWPDIVPRVPIKAPLPYTRSIPVDVLEEAECKSCGVSVKMKSVTEFIKLHWECK